MRRALLCVLAAAVIAVAGWSAVTSRAVPRAVLDSLAAEPVDALGVGARPGGGGAASEALTSTIVLGSSSTPVVLKAGAPVASTLVQRDVTLIAGALVVLAALLFLVGTRPRWFRTRSTSRWPRSAPPLQVAPRRGPPIGLARPSGS